LYLFSDRDEVVKKRDVVEHAEDAEALGYVVYMESFGKGAHCALLQEDKDRYWSSVSNLWRSV
jgi:hypothetical protein